MRPMVQVVTTLLCVLSVCVCTVEQTTLAVDENGYIAYCPCMGRFGNQADQFLGSLAFAKAANRTLILPPWVEYKRGHRNAVMEAFDSYFKVEPLLEYHRVITMEQFMAELAPSVWPVGQRKVFCYTERYGGTKANKCNAKEGNPFGPFWDWFNIDFDDSIVFSPLFYEPFSLKMMAKWDKTYPSGQYPVWAFVGPPAAFPVLSMYTGLQRYVQWTDTYSTQAEDFIREHIPNRPFLAIHLRNGPDFERACEHVSSSPSMFASQQCIGERSQYGTTTSEMCFPSTKTVTEKVVKEVLRIKAKTVFIASDFNDLKKEISEAVGTQVKVVKQEDPASAMVDLAILGQADHFIGNCVSTFTAFVKRERDNNGLSTSFWAFERKKKKKEEL